MQEDRCKTRLVCWCGYEWNIGVLVGWTVPACQPAVHGVGGDGGSRSDVFCPECRRTLFSGFAELRACVENELRSALRSHVRAGTVVVDLR